MFSAILRFKKLPCDSRLVFALTKENAERQIAQWKQEYGENNPSEPEFIILEEPVDA